MHDKRPAADFARNLSKRVKRRLAFVDDAQNARFVRRQRTDQAYGASFSHVPRAQGNCKATLAPYKIAAKRTASWTCSSPSPCCCTLASCDWMHTSHPAKAAMARLINSKSALLVLGRAIPCIRNRAGFWEYVSLCTI